MMDPVLFVFVLLVLGLGIPFGFAAFVRQQRHKETMAMIEKGLIEPPKPRPRDGKSTLRWGIVIACIGIALMIGLYPLGSIFSNGDFPLNFGPWMIIGLLPTFFGLALVLVYYLTLNGEEEDHIESNESSGDLDG
jgi:hypothetical protein